MVRINMLSSAGMTKGHGVLSAFEEDISAYYIRLELYGFFRPNFVDIHKVHTT